MRLFVAAELPAPVRTALAETAGAIAGRDGGIRPVAAESLHVTLVFVGSFPDDAVPALAASLREAAGPLAPPRLRVSGLGAFPSPGRARVVWAGLEDEDGRLAAAAAATRSVAAAHGVAVETRRFVAHVTIGRLRRPGPVTAALEGLEARSEPFAVGEITLFRSRLGRPAPVYEPLERFPLGG